jgi:hypothetical protein
MILLVLLFVAGAVAVILFKNRLTSYWNPIDSKGYVAHWETYRPENRRAQSGRTKLAHIRLLNEQESLVQNFGVERMVAFCNDIEAVIRQFGDSATWESELLLEVTLSHERPPVFQLADRGLIPQDQLQAIYNALMKLTDRRSSGKELKFQMLFQVSDRN